MSFVKRPLNERILAYSPGSHEWAIRRSGSQPPPRRSVKRLLQMCPRLVGETCGKDFVLAHRSADMESLAMALLQGVFEYQGQKCSVVSRAYVPAALWPTLKVRLLDDRTTVKIGDVADLTNFMGAVIDRKAFTRVTRHLDEARDASSVKLIAGGAATITSGISWSQP